MMNSLKGTKLYWDFGTAYDLFVSQFVLHHPERFSLRANWAAGVRSRLSPELRMTLEVAQICLQMPLRFVYDLKAEVKDSAAVIAALSEVSPLKRLDLVSDISRASPVFQQMMHETRTGHPWTEEERETIIEHTNNPERKHNPRYLDSLFFIWSDPKAYADLYLAAMKAYVDYFFAEEEVRILPALKQALSYAQMRAGTLSLPLLLEELTSGVRDMDIENLTSITMAPSFWAAPLMISNRGQHGKRIILFGARPDNMAIIPGDPVPDSLIRGLKALADPTRLRIMRFLAQSPQTPTQLSRSLRLRPPTVNHHINELRIAGLVQTTVSQGGERQFATRYNSIDAMHDLLTRYLHGM